MAILQRNNWISAKAKLFFDIDNKFWLGFLAGFFYFCYTFWWFWALYPLDSLGIQNKAVAAALIFIIFTISASIMAVWWGVAGSLGYRFARSLPTMLIPLVLAATFTLAEYLRAVFFSIFWYGDGGMIGPYWPIGNLAYLLVDLGPIASSASWWGIYGIEFWLAFFVSALVLVFLKKNDRKALTVELISSLAVLMTLWLYSGYLTRKIEPLPPTPVAVIQTNVPSSGFQTGTETLDDFKKKLNLLEKASSEIGEGIIIFPEGANFSNTLAKFLDESSMQKYFDELSSRGVFIIDSIRTTVDDNFRSTAAFISSKDGLVKTYDKQLLTPGGEFLPYIVKYPLILFSPSLRESFKLYREYSSGFDSNQMPYGDTDFNIMICSELISPNKTRQSNGSFNIIVGSFSIWNGSALATRQALAMVRFRAIESDKYTLLASNTGSSYIIDNLGRIKKSASPNIYELLTGAVVPNKSRTWYNYVGDWPILLLSAAFFAVGLKKIKDDPES